MSVRDNTNRRLKAVLDIMAAGTWSEDKPGAGVVLAEAVARVPLTDEETELLSGGIPRGHKNLTMATAKLVKAGWLVKGRSGWSITDDGLRATVEFPTVEQMAAALADGTQVSPNTPLPTAPAALAKAAARAKAAPATATKKRATPAKKTATKVADAAAETASSAQAADAAADQPASVAIAGDFSTLVGAAEAWTIHHREVQMKLDKAERTWKLTLELPAGFYNYKAVVNGTWDENYGAFGVRNGANHEFHHNGGKVTFRYDHSTNDVLTS